MEMWKKKGEETERREKKSRVVSGAHIHDEM